MKFMQFLSFFAAAFYFGNATAQVAQVSEPWARATVQGQKATGAFMTITSKEGAKLVGISSPVAGISEIHEMKMEKDVMKMSALPSLDIPAGKSVDLKPGSYHVMLMDLKAPLADNSNLLMTLTFENAKGVKSKIELQVPVKSMNMQQQHKH